MINSERILKFFAMFVVFLTVLENLGMYISESNMYAENLYVSDKEIKVEFDEEKEKVLSDTRFVFEEEFPFVPLYFQNDYPNVSYGRYGTVASHGCAITTIAMVFSYLLDEPIMPDKLAEEYGHHNTEQGSSSEVFNESAIDYGLEQPVRTSDWDLVIAALEKGQVVIANPRGNTIFTKGGHFIVLAGLTEDGRVIVRDPNQSNYKVSESPTLTKGFSIGFEQCFVNACSEYWIYQAKDSESRIVETQHNYYIKKI